MSMDSCRIRIERAANGFTVEVPDYAMMAKREAEAKKNKNGMGSPYMGDCQKEYVAKTTGEVLKLVKASLDDLPKSEYDAAYAEAAAEDH